MQNLVYRVPKKETCKLDEKLGAIVHRFDLGEHICRCGKSVVEKVEFREFNAWRRPAIARKRA